MHRLPYGFSRRTVEMTNEHVEAVKALKALWRLKTDSAVVRRLMDDYGVPALHATRNDVADIVEQMNARMRRPAPQPVE